MTHALALCLFAASIALAAGADGQEPHPVPRLDAWRIIGPGGGGTMIAPVIGPLDSSAVIEHCDMTGAYITADAGLSWRMFNLGTVVESYAFDPGNASVIYAGNNALWRSADAGKTWKMILPDPGRNTAVHMRGDHSSFDLTSDDPAYPKAKSVTITAIVVDPRDSKKISIVLNGELLSSVDNCKTWIKADRIDGAVLFAGADPKSGAVTVVTKTAVFVLDGGVLATHALPEDVAPRGATGGRLADGSLVIYATTAGGIFLTKDLGRTWTNAAGPFAALVQNADTGKPPEFTSIGCSARHGETVYVGFDSLALPGAPAWGCCGVAKSDDCGKTWRIVKREGTKRSDNASVSWVEQRMEENIARRGGRDPNVTFWPPRDIGVAPADPNICYVVDLFRTYRTLDGGKTWRTVNSVRTHDDAWTSTGLDVTTCYGVHFDPNVRNRIYITYTDIGLFRSEDNGASWIPSTTGIPLNWRNTTYWLAFDNDVKGLVWGAFSFAHDLPRPKMWRRSGSIDYEGGVAVSIDGGATWTVSNAGMSETAVTHIILDPRSPVGKRTLYACGFGTGVWKSVDNGRSWTLKNKGIDGKEPFAWRIVMAGDGTLYLLVARRNENAGSPASDDGALYRSRDGADTWEKMALPKGVNAPNGLTLDPRDEKRMYLAAWGIEYKNAPDTGGGIYLSTDAGKTWSVLKDDDQHIYDVTIDPERPDTLYACGFDSAAYRSTDAGKTWMRLKGYNFKWGHRVICDVNDPGMIYITTFGGSVWRGPAAGDPAANDDWGMSLPKQP